MEIQSFSRRTGLGPVRKSYREMGLRNGISSGIRTKHIRIGNTSDCVEGVIRKLQARICELEFVLSTKRVGGLMGTEKSCPMIVEMNSNSMDGQTRPLFCETSRLPAICSDHPHGLRMGRYDLPLAPPRWHRIRVD